MPSKRKASGPSKAPAQDQKILQSAARLMSRDPKMAATSALKSLGIEKTADLRRLRPKLSALASKHTAPIQQAALRSGSGSRRTARVDGPPDEPIGRAQIAGAAAAAGIVDDWVRLAFGTATTMFTLQARLLEALIRTPPAALAWRQQALAYNAFLESALPRRPRP